MFEWFWNISSLGAPDAVEGINYKSVFEVVPIK